MPEVQSQDSEVFTNISPVSFHGNRDIAIICNSTNAAIVFDHICYWLRLNFGKEESEKEGKTWMYQTQEEMSQYFGFISVREIQGAISTLMEHGLIIKGNFNDNRFVRTNWYTVYDQSLIDNTIKKRFTKTRPGVFRTHPPVSSEHTPGCHDIKEEETTKEREKELLRENAPPIEHSKPKVVVSKNLYKIKISEPLRKKITSEHSEEDIEIYVKRVLAWKNRDNDEAAINHVIKNKDNWTEVSSKDEIIKKNTLFLKEIANLDGKIISNIKITIGYNYVEFSHREAKVYSIEDKDFITLVKEEISKLTQIAKGKS
jgi:hypothetical protein